MPNKVCLLLKYSCYGYSKKEIGKHAEFEVKEICLQVSVIIKMINQPVGQV